MLDKTNLRILQVNLNKSPQATESALQVCVDLAIDLLVVQEPWLVPLPATGNYSNTRSINHPSFAQIFPSLPDPSLRPRVLLYASNNFQAQINPLPNFPSDPDCQAVSVSSASFEFNLINIYNEDDQQESPERTIERCLLSKQLPANTLLLGDFNTHDPWWDPLCPSISPGATTFINWIETQGLELLNTPGVGTFFRPNMSRESVLDLSFATSGLAGKIQDWQVIPGLGSDHHGLLFAIKGADTQSNAPPPKSSRFNTKPAEWDIFKSTLQID